MPSFRHAIASYGIGWTARALLCLVAGAIALLAAPGPVGADWNLTVETVVEGTGAPTTARLSVTGSDAAFYHPLPDSTCLYYTPMGGYFYADASAVVTVPAGPTRIRAAKGPEFLPVDITVDVQADTTVRLELERWIDMRSRGWIGGEAHGDLTHPPVDHTVDAADAKMAVTAEGLHVANFLDNGFNFTGAVSPLSDTSVALFPSEEYRSSVFGHLGFSGIDTLIAPDWSNDGWPLNGRIINEVRGHGNALTSYAHPATTEDFYDLSGWPGTGLARGVWVDAPLGRVDALAVLSYSNGAVPGGAALELWYRMWNCSFTLPGLAGSDTGLSTYMGRPMGGSRVYVKVDDPHAPPQALYDSWVEGIRAGHTFVTTGPLLTEFEVENAGAGETLFVADGMPIDVEVFGTFEAARDLKFVELVVNGEVTETFDAAFERSVEVHAVVPVRETSWIALRHFAPDQGNFMPVDYAVAHPTPVLVHLAGDELTSSASGAAALLKLSMLDTLLASIPYPGAAESVAVQATVDSARAVWLERSDAPPGPFHLDSPGWGEIVVEDPPTVRWHPSTDPDAGGAVTYRLVVAADAGFESIVCDVSAIVDTSYTMAETLDVGASCWWCVRAETPRGAKRWAEEIHRWFRIATPTSVEESGRTDQLRFFAAPNPARGEVTLRGHLPSPVGGTLTIYNAAGREVRSRSLPPGAFETAWDGRDGAGRELPAGVYFCHVRSGVRESSRKIVLMR